MILSKNLSKAFNEQVEAEMWSSNLYLSMSIYFQKAGLNGCAHWMRKQAEEEMEHAHKMIDFAIDRGGDITFHGPGQLVGYPILDLEREGIGLKEYIHSIEDAVIRTIADYGISGTRVAGAAGVWLTEGGPMRKIAAIGVRSSRYVTMHGFALNVNTDLRWFDYINPCGFSDRGVTSIRKETGTETDLKDVAGRFAAHLEKIINIKIKIEDYAYRKTLGNQAPG